MSHLLCQQIAMEKEIPTYFLFGTELMFKTLELLNHFLKIRDFLNKKLFLKAYFKEKELFFLK